MEIIENPNIIEDFIFNNNMFDEPELSNYDKKIIDDEYIADKIIPEIEKLIREDYSFVLTQECLINAYDNGNIIKMEYLAKAFDLNLKGQDFLLDNSLEYGHEAMAKFLAMKFGLKPSLYAKQMAHINGFISLSFWMDAFTTQRNSVSIGQVYKNKLTGQWSDVIPMKYRY